MFLVLHNDGCSVRQSDRMFYSGPSTLCPLFREQWYQTVRFVVVWITDQFIYPLILNHWLYLIAFVTNVQTH